MEKPGSQSHGVGCSSKALTTFVQTDTDTFREVVQRLTGPSSPESHAAGSKRPTSKLHERRQWRIRPKLQIVKPAAASHFKPSDHQASFSPSKIFSKLSIVEGEKEEQSVSVPQVINSIEEEKAIKERRFYLHPSPRSIPGYTQPELLTLFPLKSPQTTQKP